MTDKEKDPAQDTGDPAGEGLPEAEEPGEEEVSAGQEGDELNRVKSRLAYLVAEFDNYRKRVAREQEAIVSFGNERILLAILPFLDNLERAIYHSPPAGTRGSIFPPGGSRSTLTFTRRSPWSCGRGSPKGRFWPRAAKGTS